eukprot:TRINITY_DN13184_c0_g1_i1.p1 TRINITY_DN13184_c0_g1~~TRINITY_DN13184_c0_g1_i1.p1  ORF type:complete len:238 (+),score=31.38 TRINITY_DN13184_c0_g1_i1:32-745(+)
MAASGDDSIPVGSRVQLCNLTSHTQFNGRIGTVIALEPQGYRIDLGAGVSRVAERKYIKPVDGLRRKVMFTSAPRDFRQMPGSFERLDFTIATQYIQQQCVCQSAACMCLKVVHINMVCVIGNSSCSQVFTVAKFAAGGAFVGGSLGGTTCSVAGMVAGSTLGMLPAMLTFGLSIPVGAMLGAGAGFGAGAMAGGAAGLGPGAAMGVGYVYLKGRGYTPGAVKDREAMQMIAPVRAG